MTPAPRRQRLEAMLAEDPHDLFLRYALALELDKEGESDRSLQLLGELMRAEERYVPAFFMSGQILARLARFGEARTALRDGVEAARQQGDHHAAGEMAEFLASLGNQGE
jgi:predicted Zn-dependent protease